VHWAALCIVEIYRQRDLGTTTISLTTSVLLAVILGRYDAAARLTGAFEAASERYGVRPPASLGRFIGETDPERIARQALSQERWDAEVEAGRRMSLGEAVDLVVELAGDVA
jgi:hypothetical protein